MDGIRINTDRVVEMAGIIDSHNDFLSTYRGNFEKEIKKICTEHWKGEAANKAISKLSEINEEKRFNEIKAYANILRQYVGEGYNETEETNKNLADAFKA